MTLCLLTSSRGCSSWCNRRMLDCQTDLFGSPSTGRTPDLLLGTGQVLTYGRVVRPVLGITLAPPQAARQLGQEGVLALEVMPGSPAYKAGLHPTYR